MVTRGPAALIDTQADLDRLARDVADAWIAWWVGELAREGRALAGGWPGTMSQARARLVSHASAVLGNEHGLDESTLVSLTRRAYSAARESWRARAARDPET